MPRITNQSVTFTGSGLSDAFFNTEHECYDQAIKDFGEQYPATAELLSSREVREALYEDALVFLMPGESDDIKDLAATLVDDFLARL
jgi:hypothetical protein